LESITQLALNISKTLSKIHDAGVTHNNLGPENIIVDETGEKDTISVKIIGLGSASLMTEFNKMHLKARVDILSLGSILFEIFTGMCPFNEKSDTRLLEGESDGATFKSRNQLITILTAKVPLDFVRLLLDLMEAKGSLRLFETARDVIKELSTLINNVGVFFQIPTKK
jgi:serine/threonine protein kinase